MKRRNLIIAGVAILSIGGYLAYKRFKKPKSSPDSPSSSGGGGGGSYGGYSADYIAQVVTQDPTIIKPDTPSAPADVRGGGTATDSQGNPVSLIPDGTGGVKPLAPSMPQSGHFRNANGWGGNPWTVTQGGVRMGSPKAITPPYQQCVNRGQIVDMINEEIL